MRGCLVAQSSPILCRVWPVRLTPRTVARQALLSMGILQAIILEWAAMPSSRIFPTQESNPSVPHCRWILYCLSPTEAGVGSLPLLPGNCPIQESHWGLLHCRRILYQLSYQGTKIYNWLVPSAILLITINVNISKCSLGLVIAIIINLKRLQLLLFFNSYAFLFLSIDSEHFLSVDSASHCWCDTDSQWEKRAH